jgi:Gluconate 2-dehydrogenase subunit 3
MKRRTALKIVTLGALAPGLESISAAVGHAGENAAWSAGNYKLRFFTEEENELLDRLMEMIIPADAHSPGAHAASVSLFADLMVATGSEAVQRRWRRGLKLMRDQAAKSSLADALATSAKNEQSPGTELERFFAALKQMTVNGYYTSAIGIHHDLRYQGNTYLNAFPGCTLTRIMKGHAQV